MTIKQSNHHSVPSQAKSLEERHQTDAYEVKVNGLDIIVNKGVYQTSGDSELMAEVVEVGPTEDFLEVGCGTGAISLFIASKAKNGTGVDINKLAVENSLENARRLGVENVKFYKSDVFENVEGEFDVIIFNPPYTRHEVSDDIDRMFWDPEDEAKEKFFREVSKHLKVGGRIYFGWADFADIDVELPLKLGEKNQFKLVNTFVKKHPKYDFTFYAFEFSKGS